MKNKPLEAIIFNTTLSVRGLLLVLTPSILQIIVISIFVSCLFNMQARARYEERRRDLVAQVNALQVAMARTAISSYFQKLNPLLTDHSVLSQTVSSAEAKVDRLCEMAAQHPDQANNVRRLRKLVTQSSHSLVTIPDYDTMRKSDRLQWNLIRQATPLMRVLDDMLTLENANLVELPQKKAAARLFLHTLLGTGIVGSLLLAIVLAVFYARSISEPLLAVSENARKLALRKKLSMPLVGQDEICQFDRLLHETDAAIGRAMSRQTALALNAPSLVCSIDSEYRLAKINPYITKLTGFAASELIGKPIVTLARESNQTNLLQCLERAWHSGSQMTFETELITKHLDNLPTSWTTYQSPLDVQLFCVVHDISRLKHIERLKKELYDEMTRYLQFPLARSVAALDSLLGRHDESVPPAAKQRLESIRLNLEKCVRLLEDLFDQENVVVTHRTHGAELSAAGPMDRRPTNLLEVLDEAAFMLAEVANDKNTPVIIRSHAWEIEVDRPKILRTVLNLMANAINFSPPGSSIEVVSKQVSDCIEVSVLDRGPGVPENQRELIFKPFEQLAFNNPATPQGSGLGLSICKQFVEKHGGAIGVRTRENGGACFWFRLPLVETIVEP